MNSRRNEDDRVQRLLSLPDLATPPVSSGHVDDDTLALLSGRTASAEELASVRAHLVVCPPCRRLVGQILSGIEPSRVAVPQAPALARLWRSPAFLAWAVAACLLLGVTLVMWSLNRGAGAPRPGPQPRPGNAPLSAELLAAPVSWERNGLRGPETQRATINLTIESPRDGIAVVAMVADGHWELLRGESPLKKGPVNDYGPIDPPPGAVVYVVVLSDRKEPGELASVIRESLPRDPREFETHDKVWRDDVRARLTRGGHRWVAIEPMRVMPTEP
jgi:hypothetical protein